MASITFKHVRKTYPGGVTVVPDLNLEIQHKEFVILVGPSGCGKSTTLRMIAGLEDISDGELLIGDRVVNDVAPKDRDIAMVFQNYALYPHMTVYKNIAFGLIQKKVPKDEIDKRVHEAAKALDLEHLLNRKPKALSGGQRQRVALGRAMVRNPAVFLLDEPLSNLDAKLREQMLEEIREIQRKSGTTVLYITHDQQSALQLCDRMAIMEPDGSLCQLGTDEDIILHPANRFTFEFIGVSNFIPAEVAGGAITLRPGQKDFPWADGKLPEGTDTSKKLELGVRPNDIVFDKDSSLRVTVKRSVFLGSEYDYFVELGGRELRIQQNTLDAAKYGVMREGQETGIRLLNYRFYPEKEVSA